MNIYTITKTQKRKMSLLYNNIIIYLQGCRFQEEQVEEEKE